MTFRRALAPDDYDSSRTAAARRELGVILIVVAALGMLIWNGSSLLQQVVTGLPPAVTVTVKIAAGALVLNVALLLFGWRRYVDLHHEAELRADGERRAAIMAVTDPTTGLANRKGFADRAQAVLARAKSVGQAVAVVSLQMHRFKTVNDRHGHDCGDELLRLIANGLNEIVPPGAVLARLGADEFALAMPHPRGEQQAVAALAEAMLKIVSRPYAIDDRITQVGAFAGISSQSADQQAVIGDGLRRADIALEHASGSRAARAVWFDAGMEQELIARGELEQAIRIGLELGQFVPFFEPQVDLRTGQIIGFEVLARWDHPTHGAIGPDLFIPVAEEIGLIDELSTSIMAAALGRARDWDPCISLSVNFSPSQLGDAWLAQKIVRLLTETGFPADRLVIEITESSLFADMDMARTIVDSLKNQGIRLALDDFGTGFSSLSHLRALPLDAIKIDRSFVANLHKDRESAAIVKAVTTMGHALSVPVTVEGIEDAPTLAAVLAMGAAHAQGWYFGKAMNGDKAEELLRARQPLPLTERRTA
ncbi:putative bifunctional diguanylate cyclase/phosphodiesterase [Sphingomonas sp. GCM10030256]|uniref:putative bifunctional diguanylate cyclase/phosphodiesterase n=1 Tax=Sphingomonas sp. GCM10030256 TaxID=3273427 RepID=UPI00361DC9D2